jgi:hypothetical protein
VLPYWGILNDRKALRRNFGPKRLYSRAPPFHVCVTSYQIVVADEAALKRVKWQFMILDEAQAQPPPLRMSRTLFLGSNLGVFSGHQASAAGPTRAVLLRQGLQACCL